MTNQVGQTSGWDQSFNQLLRTKRGWIMYQIRSKPFDFSIQKPPKISWRTTRIHNFTLNSLCFCQAFGIPPSNPISSRQLEFVETKADLWTLLGLLGGGKHYGWRKKTAGRCRWDWHYINLVSVNCTAFGPSCHITDCHTGSWVFSGCEKVACVLQFSSPGCSVYIGSGAYQEACISWSWWSGWPFDAGLGW